MGPWALSAFDDVEELTRSDVDNLGGPLLSPPPSKATPQRLVQANGGDVTEPVRVVDQGLPVGDHRIHHRMPTTPEVLGDLTD